ncbi:RNA exonuclease 4 isoform X2 [Nilaparvata lugens]|nr:RNA exonuclease 4 isoform X2 [Nilaparvata lugens]
MKKRKVADSAKTDQIKKHKFDHSNIKRSPIDLDESDQTNTIKDHKIKTEPNSSSNVSNIKTEPNPSDNVSGISDKKKKSQAKQSKSNTSNNIRDINHKQSNGCSNWMKFLESEKSKQGDKMLSDTSNKQNKVPVLKQRHDEKKVDLKPFVFPGERWKNQSNSYRGKLTSLIAIDCEMVGIGEDGHVSIVARVSLVNSLGECVYDKYVKPTDPVTDYRTHVSGIRPADLENATDFHTVQSEVATILKDRILVGHSLKNDLDVLMLKHPYRLIRDTSRFSKFQSPTRRSLSLKAITEKFLNVKIQTDEHNSVEDARAAMQLYMTFRKEWEQERRQSKSNKHKKRDSQQSHPVTAVSEN